MSAKRIYVVGIMFMAGCLILFGTLSLIHEGVPKVEAAVHAEVDSLVLTDESLRSLKLERLSGARVVDSGINMKGAFYYDGTFSNQSWNITVSWHRSDTNSPIDRIEISSTYQEPKTI